MRITPLVASVLILCTSSFADGSDDTLRYFLSKSDLVVVGEIVSEPHAVVKEPGVVNYICNFKVFEVLKGGKPVEGEIRVNIVRLESHDDDRIPELKKGGKFILFLKDVGPNQIPAWETADVWFGIQRPSPWMARSLKEEAREARPTQQTQESPEWKVLSANSWRWVGPLSRTMRQSSVVWTFQAGLTGTFLKETGFTRRSFRSNDSGVISNTYPVIVDSVFLAKSVHGRSLVFTWGIAHGDLVVPAVVRTGAREWVLCISEEFSDGLSRTEEWRYRFDAELSEATRGRFDVILTTKTWRSKKPAQPPRTDRLVISGDYTVEKGDYKKSGVGLRRDNLEVRIRSPGIPGFSFDPETAVGIIRGDGRERSIVYSAAIDPRETVQSAETKMPDIAALTEALKSESSDRLTAASALGDLGADAAPAVPALIESLKIAHRNDLISDALAKVGPVAIPALVEALQDPNPNVRTGAAAALGDIGPEAKAAVPALIQSVRDPEGQVRIHVIQALGRIGGEARAAVPSLIDSLKDQQSSFRYAAVSALGQIGPGAKAAVPDLTAILQSEDEPSREEVAEALGDIGSGATAAVPALRAAVNAKHHSLPNRAIEALTRIDADAAVSTLIEVLVDENRSGLRLNAAYFLGTLASNAKSAIPALSDALKDENVLVRREAAEALGQIGPESDSAVPPLIEATRDPDPFVRVLAVKSLGLLRTSAKTAVGPLSRALNDPHPGVRYSAAVALGNIGIPDETVPPLIEALKDADTKVRRAAAESLGKIGSGAHAARSALTAALNDPTEEVRIVAAQALIKVSKVMNKKMKDSWIDAKSSVFFHNERTPAVTGSKRGTFDVESRQGAFTTIPVTTFVTPSGRKWMGPEQDYYIETDSGIMGFRMREGGIILWCSSLAKEPARKVEKQSEKADPSSGFEESVSGSDLFDAWHGIDPDARLERITDLRKGTTRTGISQWFFADSPPSSQLGMAKIVSAEINNGQLKLDLINQTEEYTASVWIDVKSKRVVKATEIKERE